MNELALFAGAGGGLLGGHLLGWRTVCAVEWDAYAASVLVARQNDGYLPSFPIWDDVQTFDGRPWRGIVDIVSGGFPYQDISSAGKGVGIDGERSGMWRHMARIIGEVQPAYAFIENSAMLRTRGLGTILYDLASLGYNAEWGVLSSNSVGANHKRARMWIVASNTNLSQRKGRCVSFGIHQENPNACNSCWWKDSSGIHRVDDGVAVRVDRLKAIGNGQVPAVARLAWNILAGKQVNQNQYENDTELLQDNQ